MYEPIGYADTENGGPLVCDGCATADERDERAGWALIFADSETDSPYHCDRCGDLIPETLTPDGWKYVRDAIIDGDGDRKVLRAWFDHYVGWTGYARSLCTAADFSLGDDGTMDTVIVAPDGSEHRFSYDAPDEDVSLFPGESEDERNERLYAEFVQGCMEELAADWAPAWLDEDEEA